MTKSYEQGQVKTSLWSLLIIFITGILCLQAFNLVFAQIGEAVGAPEQAPLISAIPGIILGIVCFIYGSLGDFVSLKKMCSIGIALLLIGSLGGFFIHNSIWEVIIFRGLQTAGAQVAGSVYLVLCAKYLKDEEKFIYFGIFTAAYQLSTAIGVLAGGVLASIDWAYLFLIPVVGVIFYPVLMNKLPSVEAENVHIDGIGFTIFGLAIGVLTLFFTYQNMMMLTGSLVLFIIFAIYINKAKNPFITPEFFKNKRWLMSIVLMAIFYFVNYVVAPLANNVGHDLYGLNSADVSFYLVWCYLVGAVVAISSGKIVAAIGRQKSIILSAIFYTAGFAISSFTMKVGMEAFAFSLCLIYAGFGLMFSPLVDTILSCVSQDQVGRGIGMNDLVMNVTASIGIAVYGGVMGLIPASDTAQATAIAEATYSHLLLVSSGIGLLGLLIYLGIRKKVYVK